ncbi:Maf family protein [Fuchsiella alkaliacetigena]|uniref:Maf family protein n=1 Tax=Fuchsiella alkaliacetigena TaxID=957042 RepID=UPI00200B04D1|nr:nucleoside triphosphate pyrophosphatase [Fuchsiella alkaliacetigena]MCK8825597.1 Maf family protein [Fuchsiella alkaliacetigena]
MERIVLASASPRRRDLLKQIGVEFTVVPSGIDESQVEGSDYLDLVQRLAQVKATQVAQTMDSALIIAADTIVVYNKEEVLGKPNSKREAEKMLKKLSGTEHQVITGIAIKDLNKSIEIVDYEITDVLMRELTQQEITDYVATGEPMDKAGAYAIQGRGAILINSIRGLFSNVVGLPLTKVVTHCKKLGYKLA